MSLTVEDGTGKTDADSYLSVANADTYISKHGNSSAWDDSNATGSLHIAVQPTDGDTVTIDSKTYTFETTLTDVDGNVAIGSTLAYSQANLRAAINLDIDQAEDADGYADSMTKHTTVTAGVVASNAIPITAITEGTDGNLIATTETFTDELNHFEAATLSGGTDDKEEALRLATQYLDNTYGYRFKGRKMSLGQSLEWPRAYVETRDGFGLPSDEIPQKLLDACAELALRHLTETDGLMPDLSESGSVEQTMIKVGPITDMTKFAGSNSPVKKFRIVDMLLSDLLVGFGRMERA